MGSGHHRITIHIIFFFQVNMSRKPTAIISQEAPEVDLLIRQIFLRHRADTGSESSTPLLEAFNLYCRMTTKTSTPTSAVHVASIVKA